MADQSPVPRWLRSIRAVITGKPAQNQQPEGGSETQDKEEEQGIEDNINDCPRDACSDDSEDEASVSGAPDDHNTADTSPKNNTALGHMSSFINALIKIVANKVAHIAARSKEAVATVKQLGVMGVTKAVRDWIKLHPWKTALIVVPLVALICTAIALSAMGFGPAGVVAGSTAAIIHAGLGNVVAGSLFAPCTSAMMGGYGALIVFGGVWLSSTAVMICLATAWKRWKSCSQRTMVVSGRGSTNASTERSNQAVPDVMFWTMVAAAYVVYRFKSWYRGRGSPDRKLKDE